jgi:GGDEF domain-containing protein
MREFQLGRYLRRWWWLIAICSALGGIVFYMVLARQQTYTAQTLLEFVNSEAEEGLYPTGDAIDVQEIRSSTVIAGALADLGRTDSTDNIRSRVGITSVIPSDVQAIQQAQWENGSSYDYFPTSYIISYTSDEGESADAARRMLEAIIDEYIALYAEKYVSIIKVSSSIASLQNLNYDYIEYAEVINSFIEDNMTYLEKAMAQWPNFRASATGYSFSDLYNEYDLLYTVYIPSLYERILNQHVTKDSTLLQAKYQYRMEKNDRTIQNDEESLELIWDMIENYSDKNRDSMEYHWNAGSDTVTDVPGERYVLGQVYDYADDSSYVYQEISYDTILDRYISVKSEIAAKERDNEYCRYILSYYTDAEETVEESDINRAEELITLLENRLRTLDTLLNQTATEHSEVETVNNVRIRSTVNVGASINLKLYTLLIVVVFFLFGCVGAIVLGRGLDFVEYRFYTDPITRLPNRARCDREMNALAENDLPLPFTCVVITLVNLEEINTTVGRENGNEVMRLFAGYIEDCAEGFGFVGYNGSKQFIGLFRDCDEAHAEYYKNMLVRKVDEFNGDGHGAVIRFKIATTSTTETTPYKVRELLSATMKKLRTAPIINEQIPKA